ncbi:hypothetical protein OR263_37725 [Streptomyces sp. NEAU-H22]|uniref:hypothetical protein n=1 Tax=unclassified Streptomyces TaxID=2593676 RepID=UPI00225AF37E|nr:MULTISPECIES: hypothetical protein [unclassified Streptomyces]MCX3292375.1 hypothetical protein [Streptomyces sp. NEAU-H22]WMD04139.1 hypothetical protein Q7C01_06920 [Streptomyces sp. FXY-T5]
MSQQTRTPEPTRIPVTEVARRAGDSPEVIHRRCAGVIDDSEKENNKKSEKTTGWDIVSR